MDKREPCTVHMRGAEWNALIGVFSCAQKLLTALDNERLLHGATIDEIRRLNEAYQHYHEARVRIEADYMQRDTLEMRLALTLSRWKSKHKITHRTNVRWAVHHGDKAPRLEYQAGVVAWFELDKLECADEAASRAAFEQLLEDALNAQGA